MSVSTSQEKQKLEKVRAPSKPQEERPDQSTFCAIDAKRGQSCKQRKTLAAITIDSSLREDGLLSLARRGVALYSLCPFLGEITKLDAENGP